MLFLLLVTSISSNENIWVSVNWSESRVTSSDMDTVFRSHPYSAQQHHDHSHQGDHPYDHLPSPSPHHALYHIPLLVIIIIPSCTVSHKPKVKPNQLASCQCMWECWWWWLPTLLLSSAFSFPLSWSILHELAACPYTRQLTITDKCTDVQSFHSSTRSQDSALGPISGQHCPSMQ